MTLSLEEIKRQLHKSASDFEINLKPTLAENKIKAFEKKYRIILPHPYRTMIKTIANGIEDADESPFIFSLEQSIEYFKKPSENLSMDFPYSTAYAQQIFKALKANPEGDFFEIMAQEEISQFQQKKSLGGCIYLGGDESEPSVLVVRGEEYGKIWRLMDYDSPEGGQLYDLPKKFHFKPISFEQWLAFHLQNNGFEFE